jgi:hypothetical protein
MKILGTISELVKVILRKSTYEVTVQPSTVTADTTFELPAAGGGTKAIVTADSSATLTNKTIDSDSNTITNIVDADIKAAAGIVYSKLSIADGDLTIAKTSGLQTALDSKVDENLPITGATKTKITYDAKGLVTAGADIANTDMPEDIARSKLAPGTANHVLINDGTGEITSEAQLATSRGGTGVNSTATFPSTGTVVTRDATETLLNKTTVSSTGAATGALTLPTGNTSDRTGLTTTGMVRFNTSLTSFEGYDGTTWSGIGGGGTTDRVTQASHAFVVGNVLYLNGATYAKARSDVANTAEVVGMVSRVIDANTFEITLSGEVSGLTGLTAGEVYFLSPITAGDVTATEPSVVGQVSLPVGIASSTTTMYVQPKRGVLVGATNVRTQIALAASATTTVQNVSAYDAGELSGYVIINATASLRFFVNAQFSRNGAGTNYNVSYQASGDMPPAGFQITITAAGLLQVVMPSVAGFTSAAITYGLDVAAVGATLPLSISARAVLGDVSGTAVPAGYIGEVITSSVTTATNVGTTGQYFNLTSITLTPGTYLINASAKYNRNSATFSSVDLEIGFSATTGNSSTGLVTGVSLIEKVQDVGLTFTQTPISMPTVYLRYDGTTATIQNGGTLTPTGGVFYLKGYCGVYSAATPQYYCTVTAVRIA